MAAIAARVGRAVLAVAAVVFAVVAVGLVDNPRAPGWLIGACAVLAVFAGAAWYWTGLIGRSRAPLAEPVGRAIEVPGGLIVAHYNWASPDLENVVVVPADGRGPLRLGTLSLGDWHQLTREPDAWHLRGTAVRMGGVR